MLKWHIFDLYNQQTKAGTFSAEKKKEAYEGYQRQVHARYLNRQSAVYYSSSIERIRAFHAESKDSAERNDSAENNGSTQTPAQLFYIRTSQVRDAVLADFALLSSMIEDKALFDKLRKDEQDRIRYYHYDYATLLMDDAIISDHDYDKSQFPDIHVTRKYQKIIDKYIADYKLTSAPPAVSATPSVEQKDAVANKRKEKAKSMAFHSIEWTIYGFGFFNIYRLLITFLRYTWFYLVSIARSLRWLEAIPFAVDADLLMSPTPIFNILSVMLFLGRLIFDFAATLVHTFFPTEAEKGVNFVERFHMEWRRRYPRMVNDVAWSMFNALTNFAWVFSIPTPVAGILLVCFLAFDIYWFGYQWRQDELAIKEQKRVLEELEASLQSKVTKDATVNPMGVMESFVDGELLEHDVDTNQTSDVGTVSPIGVTEVVGDGASKELGSVSEQDAAELDGQLSFARLRLRDLECRRSDTRATYIFCVAAAILLVASFALFLAFMASPLAAPLCFFGCAFAVAMYINCGKVGAVARARHERNLSLDNPNTGKSLDESKFFVTLDVAEGSKAEAIKAEYQKARQKAYYAKIKSLALGFTEVLLISAVLIALYAINWPAALALTLTYIVVKSIDFKKAKSKFFPAAKDEKDNNQSPTSKVDASTTSANTSNIHSDDEDEIAPLLTTG